MSPLEMANVLQLAGSYRESSWNNEEKKYSMDWSDAVSKALKELKQPEAFTAPLSILLFPEYVDVWEWVEKTIAEATSGPR